MQDRSLITKQREDAMKRIAGKIGAEETIVFLLEGQNALASYAINVDASTSEKLLNLIVPVLSEKNNTNEDSSGYAHAGDKLRVALSKLGLNADQFSVFPMKLNRGLISFQEDTVEIIGFLVCNVQDSEEIWALATTELELFTLSLHARRNQRIIEAVAAAQVVLAQQDTESTVDNVIETVATEVKKNISATHCIYQNLNSFDDWISIGADEDSNGSASDIEFMPTIDRYPISRRLINLTSAGARITEREALHVPLSQPGYELSNLPFSPYSQFIEKLNPETVRISSLLFTGKQNRGYLQSRFSATDRSVAQSVFGYLDQFASAKTFERNYQKVLRSLKANSIETEIDAVEIWNLLKTLSIAFSNVFCLNAEYEDGSLDLEVSSANDQSELSADYLERLKNNYLAVFYSSSLEYEEGEMMMGLDKCDDGFDFEIHFPSTDGRSRIFVVRFERESVTESVLRSLIHFFSELEVRTRKTDYHRGRANYLMQVRHAVIHHFSAADKGIRHLRMRWRKGGRSAEYWANLRLDPIVRNSIQKAHFSLSQARLILENGRFLLRDISPSSLNRKPFDVEEAVRDAFTILEDQRSSKNLLIKSALYGSRPSIMNADQELMSMAILNLVDNAMKFSPNKHTIKWTLSYGPDSYKFSIASGGAKIGEGQKKLIQKLGVRGRQQDHLNQRHGTGLGLTVTDRILRAHWTAATLKIEREQIEEIKGGANVFSFEMPYLTGRSNPSNRAEQIV